MKLAGEVAVVTGAGRGIGRGIALANAKEGAKVALLARTVTEIEAVAKEISDNGGEARALAVDIVDLRSVMRVFAAVENEFGPVSLLVNNAGAFGAIVPIWEVEPATWWPTSRPTFAAPSTAAAPRSIR
jgi:NAD(P)-dependent dehydrogenase (short-subunit alcohol dehydrogenase family)